MNSEHSYIDVFIGLIFILGFYFIPTIIAFSRDHSSKFRITILNLILGWSGLAWIVALIWSLSDTGRNNPIVIHITNTVQEKGSGVTFDSDRSYSNLSASDMELLAYKTAEKLRGIDNSIDVHSMMNFSGQYIISCVNELRWSYDTYGKMDAPHIK
jgi:hypothetical protein